MDVVFTYLNGENVAWANQCAQATQSQMAPHCTDRGELVFAVRLLLRYCATWLRKVHIVHAGSGVAEKTVAVLEQLLPADRLHLVPQDELIPQPTFCSCVVEAHLHRIPGLTPIFMYCNDDMFIGQPLFVADLVHTDGTPFVDVNVYSNPNAINLAQQHCVNAKTLFQAVFPNSNVNPHRWWVSHFASMLTVAGCRRTWHCFQAHLDAPPLVRTATTINFQFLANLTMAHFQLGHIRLRTPTYRRIMIEMQPDGLDTILRERPHYFCINGVTNENQARFAEFCQAYLVNEPFCFRCPPCFLACKKIAVGIM